MVAPESCPAPGRTADSTWRTARPPSWLSRAPARRARRGASLGEGAFPGRTLTPVGGAGASPRGSGWVLGSRRGHPRAVGPPAPSRPAPARPVRPAPRPPSAPPLPAAGGPSASLSRAAERTGAGHAADGGEGAGPGKGTRGPGTPHPWRPLIPTPGAGPPDPISRPSGPFGLPEIPCLGPRAPGSGKGLLGGMEGRRPETLRAAGPWGVPTGHPILPDRQRGTRGAADLPSPSETKSGEARPSPGGRGEPGPGPTPRGALSPAPAPRRRCRTGARRPRTARCTASPSGGSAVSA